MKRLLSTIVLVVLVTLIALSINVYADSLDTIDISLSKEKVKPGDNVKVLINFGENLGAFTFDVAYDQNLFEYVSVSNGTPNDTKDKVRVTFYDSTGGSSPLSNLEIVFKAKENIETSNPTDFSITAEGLSNSDASITYDDILVPIKKTITVEPEYVDYNINLTYSGDIIENEEKEMKLTYSSKMGKFYDKARLIAEVENPEGGKAILNATDSSSLIHDIIQSGWGDPDGFKIGGKDFNQTLNVTGLFNKQGEYKLTLKLIDRENSDTVIAENTFKINVNPKESNNNQDSQDGQNNQNSQNQGNVDNESEKENISNDKNNEKLPDTLPKTGFNIYAQIISVILLLAFVLVIIKIKNNRKIK